MNIEERKKITGGLSKPSKMPGYAYNLPAIHCKTGSKLAQVRHGRHDEKTCQHKPARLGQDHGRGHQRTPEPLVQVA